MGLVCAKHQEYFETQCRWCEPKEFEGYEMLPVSTVVPAFKRIAPPSLAQYLGAEQIGPQESRFWLDVIGDRYCDTEPLVLLGPGNKPF